MKNISILCKRNFCKGNSKKLLVSFKKETSDGYDKSQFIDSRITRVFGGRGGNGAIALLREFCRPLAGPSGGDGGNGGHVIFQACSNALDLRNIPSFVRGENGCSGSGKAMDGVSGEHKYFNVPIGTLIKCYKTDKLLSELGEEGAIYIAARGGQGGKGNLFFVSPEHCAPTLAEEGAPGEENQLMLEVKLLADIGLVGIPNAGKSSLLRALTRARPKVAEYAFTTLKPHIGSIEFNDKSIDPITVCDIPGIIQDSHINRGLGLEFLRHIERCRILAFILDLSNEPIDQYGILLHELELYRPMLLRLERLIICNKMDLPGTREVFEHFRQYLLTTDDSAKTVAVSALNSTNINKVVLEMKKLKDKTLMYG